jgi:hypothetical protein
MRPRIKNKAPGVAMTVMRSVSGDMKVDGKVSNEEVRVFTPRD